MGVSVCVCMRYARLNSARWHIHRMLAAKPSKFWFDSTTVNAESNHKHTHTYIHISIEISLANTQPINVGQHGRNFAKWVWRVSFHLKLLMLLLDECQANIVVCCCCWLRYADVISAHYIIQKKKKKNKSGCERATEGGWHINWLYFTAVSGEFMCSGCCVIICQLRQRENFWT